MITKREEYLILRRRKKISQGEIAKILNCSQSLIAKYETGNCGMSDKKIKMYREHIDSK